MNRIPTLRAHHITTRYISNASWPMNPTEVIQPPSEAYLAYTNGQLTWATSLANTVYGIQDGVQDDYAVIEPADHVFPGQSVGIVLGCNSPSSLTLTKHNNLLGCMDFRSSTPAEDYIVGSHSIAVGRNTSCTGGYSAVYGDDNSVLGGKYSVICSEDQCTLDDCTGSVILGGSGHEVTFNKNVTSGYWCTTYGDYTVAGGATSHSNRMLSIYTGGGSFGGTPVISVSSTGGCYSGVTNTDGADYTEMYESQLEYKIPVGTTIVFEQDVNPVSKKRYIRPCQQGEIPVGVISDTSGTTLKTAYAHWRGKYIMTDKIEDVTVLVTEPEERTIEEDVYNEQEDRWYRVERTVVKDVPIYDTVDVYKNGNVVKQKRVPRMKKVGTKIAKQRTINPLYDESRTYIPREDRPEWNVVGLLGRCKVLHLQPVDPHWILLEEGDKYNVYLVR